MGQNELENKYLSLISVLDKHEQCDIDNMKLCFELLSVANLIDKSCAKKLANYNLSESRFLLLAILSKYQPLSPQKLTSLCGVTKATMTQFLNTLMHDELIIKQACPEDARMYQVSLTNKGVTLVSTLLLTHTHWMQNITANLDNDEAMQLSYILGKIRTNLQKID